MLNISQKMLHFTFRDIPRAIKKLLSFFFDMINDIWRGIDINARFSYNILEQMTLKKYLHLFVL